MLTKWRLFSALVSGDTIRLPNRKNWITGRIIAIELESGCGQSFNVTLYEIGNPIKTIIHVRTID